MDVFSYLDHMCVSEYLGMVISEGCIYGKLSGSPQALGTTDGVMRQVSVLLIH